MKFILFAILLCLSVCYLNAKDPMKISLVSGRVTDRILGMKNITVSLSFFHSQNYTFTYPEVCSNKKKENSKRWENSHSLSETIAIRNSVNSAHGLQIDASFGENLKWRHRPAKRHYSYRIATISRNWFQIYFLHFVTTSDLFLLI